MTPGRGPDTGARRSVALLLGAALAMAALLWQGRAQLSEHIARWSGGAHPTVTLDWKRLSPGLDAAGLARLLDRLPLQCRPVPDGSVCEAMLGEIDGLLASGLRASWRGQSLQEVAVRVPWWTHHRATALLVQRLGPPGGDAPVAGDEQPGRALTWTLPSGTVSLARAPGWNPMAWATLHWGAAGTPRP